MVPWWKRRGKRPQSQRTAARPCDVVIRRHTVSMCTTNQNQKQNQFQVIQSECSCDGDALGLAGCWSELSKPVSRGRSAKNDGGHWRTEASWLDQTHQPQPTRRTGRPFPPQRGTEHWLFVTPTWKSSEKFDPLVRKIRPLETRASSSSTPLETWCRGWAPSRPPRGLAAPMLDSNGPHGTHAPTRHGSAACAVSW